MAPQVGLEPHPEISTAEVIVLNFLKNARKTSVDAGFNDSVSLPQQTLKTSQIAGRQYKSSTFFQGEVCSMQRMDLAVDKVARQHMGWRATCG